MARGSWIVGAAIAAARLSPVDIQKRYLCATSPNAKRTTNHEKVLLLMQEHLFYLSRLDFSCVFYYTKNKKKPYCVRKWSRCVNGLDVLNQHFLHWEFGLYIVRQCLHWTVDLYRRTPTCLGRLKTRFINGMVGLFSYLRI